ncbi:MAG: wax ester/triacylglycerol synthase family O-acyltransferase [Terriglobales bacterium]
MAELKQRDSLSFGDALFLYLEREGMPLHIASASIFDGEIPLEQFMSYIETKLDVVPRYRQRVKIPPLNLGLPTWSHDPEFDVRNHIRETRLSRSTTAAFKEATARILSQRMDHGRPLWDLTLVHGLPGNRTGLIVRVHHCLADGLAGIGLMNALMDASPAPPRTGSHPRSAAPTEGQEPSLLDSLVQSSLSAVQQLLSAHSELLSFAETLVAAPKPRDGRAQAEAVPNSTAQSGVNFATEFNRLLPEVAAPAERLPFNIVCRGPQKFHWAEIPLAQIKAVKDACGATVNDVALATIVSAVRRYAELHRVRVRGRSLRIVVPVSVRAKEDSGELGNRITFLPVTLPLDISNPTKLIAVVREQMTQLKNARLAEFVGFAGTLLGTIPSPLQALLGPLVSQLPLSICNLIFTNVRGSETPLYLLGHKMVACYPYVPIGGEMGMNCAVLTYNGTAFFGFTGDVNAVPDLGQFEKLLAASFGEFKKVLIPTKRNPKRPRAVKPSPDQPVTGTVPLPPRVPPSSHTPSSAEDAPTRPPVRDRTAVA